MIKDETYYNSLDKRTTEFKEWKKSQDIEPHKEADRGLGDTVERITKATGIDKLVKFIAGEDCGCDERKAKLNKLFQFRNSPKCLNEDEHTILTEFFERNPKQINHSETTRLNEIHFRVFGYREGTCDGCIRTMVSNLRHVYNSYED